MIVNKPILNVTEVCEYTSLSNKTCRSLIFNIHENKKLEYKKKEISNTNVMQKDVLRFLTDSPMVFDTYVKEFEYKDGDKTTYKPFVDKKEMRKILQSRKKAENVFGVIRKEHRTYYSKEHNFSDRYILTTHFSNYLGISVKEVLETLGAEERTSADMI